MIPREFHLIWLGPKPLPSIQVDGWRDKHPDWPLTVWDEAAIRTLPLRNIRAFDHYLNVKAWHGAANVARYEIILRRGGIYVDMDTTPTRPWDDAPFLDADLFTGLVQPRAEFPGLLGNAYIGAIPGHPAMADLVASVGRMRNLMPPWRTSGVVGFTQALGPWRDQPGVVILPTAALYPHDRFGRRAPDADTETWAVHHWGSTISSPWEYPA